MVGGVGTGYPIPEVVGLITQFQVGPISIPIDNGDNLCCGRYMRDLIESVRKEVL